MAGIALTGLASGMDTSTIVSQLMAIEGNRRTRMTWRQTELNANQTDLKAVQSRLNALKTAATALRDVGAWGETQTVESSDTRVVAERVGGTGPGGYEVKVLTLARAEQQSYAFAPSAEEATIDFGGGKTVTLAAGATLADAVTALNSSSQSPVYAAAVDGRLVLSARTTGVASTFTATGTTVSDKQVTKPGVDASYTVDGGAVQYAATNVVEHAIPGVKLTFKGTTATAAAITVGAPGLDVNALKTKMKAFVDAYNGVVNTTRAITDEQRVPNATTASAFAQGNLHGDSGLNQMLSRLRMSMTDAVAGLGAGMDELAEMGISTGKATGTATADQKKGLLTFDEATFTKALGTDVNGVKAFFGVGAAEGFADRLEEDLKAYVGSSGVIDSRIDQGTKSLKTLSDQMGAEDLRLAAKQKRLQAQFAAMENALRSAQSQQSWLTGQIASLPQAPSS